MEKMEEYHNNMNSPHISFMMLNDSDPKYTGKMEKKKE